VSGGPAAPVGPVQALLMYSSAFAASAARVATNTKLSAKDGGLVQYQERAAAPEHPFFASRKPTGCRARCSPCAGFEALRTHEVEGGGAGCPDVLQETYIPLLKEEPWVQTATAAA